MPLLFACCLQSLPGAEKRLRLFEADLCQAGSFDAAVQARSCSEEHARSRFRPGPLGALPVKLGHVEHIHIYAHACLLNCLQGCTVVFHTASPFNVNVPPHEVTDLNMALAD
jgi:hypothetical protein